MANVVVEAAKAAHVPSKKEMSHAKTIAGKVAREIKSAQYTRKHLFGIEEHAKGELDLMIETLKAKKSKYDSLRKYKLPCVDLEVFSWRWKNGYPKLAIIGLDSPKVSIEVRARRNYNGRNSYTGSSSPRLPDLVMARYKDVVANLTEQAKVRRKTIILETTFTGIIPSATREKILQAKKTFKEVYIVAEAPADKWKIREEEAKEPRRKPSPPNYDPLVVGWDGSNLWLVDQFNLTSLENLVKSEFAV